MNDFSWKIIVLTRRFRFFFVLNTLKHHKYISKYSPKEMGLSKSIYSRSFEVFKYRLCFLHRIRIYWFLIILLQVGVFDLDVDDPLKLSNIVGEAVVSCWSMANILPTETKDVEGTKRNQSCQEMRTWHLPKFTYETLYRWKHVLVETQINRY